MSGRFDKGEQTGRCVSAKNQLDCGLKKTRDCVRIILPEASYDVLSEV